MPEYDLRPDLMLITYEDNEYDIHINQRILLTKSDETWDSPEIQQTGTYEYYTPLTFTSDEEVYVSYAIQNHGYADADPFKWTITVDGVQKYSRYIEQPLAVAQVGTVWYQQLLYDTFVNLGRFAPGMHTLTINLDTTNAVSDEIHEDNNEWSIVFEVTPGETKLPTYLLESSWNQHGDDNLSYGYNRYAPEEYLTGCVSVANGQILYYWAKFGYEVSLSVNANDYFTCQTYTQNTAKTTSYTVTAGSNLQEHCGITLAELNEKLATITYDLPNEDWDDDIAALCVAGMLINHATAHKVVTIYTESTETKYDETSATFNASVLQRADFNYTYVSNVTANTWDTIRENLLAGMPVMISSDYLSHVMVVDGYDQAADEYHINFGWGEEVSKHYDEDEKFQCYIGNGWYTPEEIAVFSINYALVDVLPKGMETVITGCIVDGTDMQPIVEDDGRAVGGVMVFPMDAGYFVPISLQSDNIKVNFLGNTDEEDKVAFSINQEDRYEYEISFNVQRSLKEHNTPVIMQPAGDGIADVFLARAYGGVWEKEYSALNTGYIADNDEIVNGFGEKKNLDGRNKICDVFAGSEDANVLVLTDDDWGDALFLDDVYSASGYSSPNHARLSQINEIYAGAGDDIVDMTSKKFKYQGDGMIIHGGDGDDVLWSNKGNNVLYGDGGNDWLVGTRYNDEIFIGGTGDDTMHGVSGNNVFCFGENWGDDYVQVQPEGTATLVFADSFDPGDIVFDSVACTISFTNGQNASVTIDEMTIISSIYVGTTRIYGTGEINYADYSDYCDNQDSSGTIALAWA